MWSAPRLLRGLQIAHLQEYPHSNREELYDQYEHQAAQLPLCFTLTATKRPALIRFVHAKKKPAGRGGPGIHWSRSASPYRPEGEGCVKSPVASSDRRVIKTRRTKLRIVCPGPVLNTRGRGMPSSAAMNTNSSPSRR